MFSQLRKHGKRQQQRNRFCIIFQVVEDCVRVERVGQENLISGRKLSRPFAAHISQFPNRIGNTPLLCCHELSPKPPGTL
jgi:hypothetical protein